MFYQGLGFSYPIKIMCSSGFAIIGVLNMLYAYKRVEEKGVLIYAVIIAIMVGKSVGNALRDMSLFTGMIVVGSTLFFLSDMMLLLAWFSTIEGRWTSHICMGVYYPGLCLLAGAMLPYIKKHTKDIY